MRYAKYHCIPNIAWPGRPGIRTQALGTLGPLGEPDWIPASHLCPDPVPAVAGIWEGNWQMKNPQFGFSLSSSLCSRMSPPALPSKEETLKTAPLLSEIQLSLESYVEHFFS